MCQVFSCIVGIDKKVTWKFGVDSHTELQKIAGYRDHTSDPAKMEFARVEITPDNRDYIHPDNWTLKVDESIRPAWFSVKHEEAARAAHKKWERKLDKILVRQEFVHPFKLDPPPVVTERHKKLLAQWDSVGASVWDSVRASVGASVVASVGASVGDSVGASVGDSVWASVWDSVGASVWASVWDSVGASVWDSVGASVWDSVRASVGAYTGSFFRLPKWKYIKHLRGKYPFEPCVKLWRAGLVPSFDGKTWRLHGGPKAAILFSITAEELKRPCST